MRAVVDHHQAVHRPGHLLHGVGDQDDGGVFGLCGRSRMLSRMLSTPTGSSPAVGSSRMSTRGLHGDDARDGHPALLAAGELEGGLLQHRRPSGPRSWAACRTRRSISPSSSPMFLGPKEISLYTVSSKSWYSGYWNTSPTWKRVCAGALLVLPDVLPLEEDLAGGGL